MSSRSAQPFVSIPPAEHAVSSFYISYRGFDAATRPPGGLRRPGSPSQALWVGEDRTCPPCPRSGRSAPRTLAHRAPWGARKRRRSRSANGTRLATRQHTHAPKKALPESTGCRVTNLAIRMSEHSIIKFHVCSKQVQKDSSPEDEEEEQASPLREDHRTLLLAPRCGPRWR